MIVYDLSCDQGHRFEGWFGSSADFDAQCERGLVVCPQCDSALVTKAPMAPAVPAKANRAPAVASTASAGPILQASNTAMPPEVLKAFNALAEAQGKALKDSTWVGDRFADQARSMHYGETAQAAIHGAATRSEAAELAAEGVPIAPLLFPVAPPEELN